MKLIVTGSAGFIGSALISRLLKAGHDVVGIDNLDDYYDVNLKLDRLEGLCKGKNFRAIEADIEDYAALNSIFNEFNPNVVINLAAKAGVRNSISNPASYLSTNILGFHNVMELATKYKCDHFIYASSSSVYGANTRMPYSVEDSVNHQLSPYAVTKKTNELLTHVNSHLYGLPCTGLRFFTVYGPWGRPDMALFKFTKAILNDQEIEIYNNGEHLRDFTYIDDVVESIIRVIDSAPPKSNLAWNGDLPDPSFSSAPWAIYNVGNSMPIKLSSFIDQLEIALKKTAKKKYLNMQMGDVSGTHSNMDSFYKKFNYLPKTSIETGVDRFVNWYIQYYKEK